MTNADCVRPFRDVSCVGFEPCRSPGQHHVYLLSVTDSDGTKRLIKRHWSAFFDLQSLLRQTTAGQRDLRHVRFQPAGVRTTVYPAGSHNPPIVMDRINRLCQELLTMPGQVASSPAVVRFFRRWPTDVCSQVIHRSNSQPALVLRTPATAPIVRISTATPHVPSATAFRPIRQLSLRCKPTSGGAPLVGLQRRIQSFSFGRRPTAPQTAAGVAPGGIARVPVTSPQTEAASQQHLYRAVRNYQRRREGELDMRTGDIVHVTEKSWSGWWFGAIEGKEGWMPGAYLEPAGQIKSPSALQPTTERFEAARDYKSQRADEVELVVGAEVEVLQRSLDGWWTVRSGGRLGLAPATLLHRAASDGKFLDVSGHEAASPFSLIHRGPPPRRVDADAAVSAEVPRTLLYINGDLQLPAASKLKTTGNSQRVEYVSLMPRKPEHPTPSAPAWFKGAMTRDVGETLLKRSCINGQFLVREGRQHNYVISVFHDGSVHHCIVDRKDGKLSIGNAYFPGLSAIVQHYTQRPLLKAGAVEVKLSVPFTDP